MSYINFCNWSLTSTTAIFTNTANTTSFYACSLALRAKYFASLQLYPDMSELSRKGHYLQRHLCLNDKNTSLKQT